MILKKINQAHDILKKTQATLAEKNYREKMNEKTASTSHSHQDAQTKPQTDAEFKEKQ